MKTSYVKPHHSDARLYLVCILLYLFPLSLLSQSADGFNYQAVVRAANGNPLPNNNTGFRFSILQGSESGTLVYSETYDLNTDAEGIISLVIGHGSVVSGNYATIPWHNSPFFLKVEMDPGGGTSYSLVETRQIHSVPLALHSQKSDAISAGKLVIMGDETQNPEEALFEVLRSDGQTVFAVYPDGARIYIEDLPGKGSKGDLPWAGSILTRVSLMNTCGLRLTA